MKLISFFTLCHQALKSASFRWQNHCFRRLSFDKRTLFVNNCLADSINLPPKMVDCLKDSKLCVRIFRCLCIPFGTRMPLNPISLFRILVTYYSYLLEMHLHAETPRSFNFRISSFPVSVHASFRLLYAAHQ